MEARFCHAGHMKQITGRMLVRRRSGALSGLLLLFSTLALILAACGGDQAKQQPPTPIALPPLPPIGGLPPAASGLQATGQLSPDTSLQLSIGLATNRQALEDDLAAMYDPNSPQYGQYLTPDEIASRYGAPQASIDKVTAFLQGQGFQIEGVSALHDSISVSATVAQVVQTFGVLLQTFQVQGQTVFAPNGTGTLPPALQSLVTSITGLNSFAQPRPRHAPVTPASASTPGQHGAADCSGAQSNGVTMPQIANVYGYSKAYKAGYTGKGVSVGIVEFNDQMNMNDLTNFLTCSTGGKLHYSLVKVDGGSQVNSSGADGEAELDFELLGALAPDAQLVEYQAPCSDCGDKSGGKPFAVAYVDILNQIAAENKVQAVSASWGYYEGSFTAGEKDAFDQAIKRLAAEGITFSAATGDCGAYDNGTYGQLSVDIPAADPYTVAVGGTMLQPDNTSNRQSEPAWDTYKQATDPVVCQYNDWGDGGGLSTYFKQPSWQKGTGVKNKYSNGERELPDIASIAWNIAIYEQGQWGTSGGTSAATPIWTAGLALVDQGLRQHHKHSVGASPTFYQVANKHGKYTPFFDVTQGDNVYYPATAGYDLASGWGAPNILDFGKVLGAF